MGRHQPETCAMTNTSPERQLRQFLDKYTPEIAGLAQEVLEAMRARLPGAVQLVYDNYNALAIGFGPTERASDAVFSIALYPRWVTLFFLQGAALPDPHKVLKGSGKLVRHLVLQSAADLERPEVRQLMAAALQRSSKALDPAAGSPIVIKSVSAKQRPRRPS
jgi:hypothetical protein